MALGPRRRPPPKPVPRRGRPRSCVWWFLFGVLLGSFGVALYWMTHPGAVPTPTAALPKTERPAPQQPSFQFEKILRETVVDSKDNGKPPPPPAPRPEPPPPTPVVPEPPSEAPAAAERPKPGTPAEPTANAKADAKTTAEGGTYILQVGSFTTAQKADSARARLAMLGVTTRVQTITRKDGQVWHRVITGHLNGKKAMEATRATLRKNGTEAIPVTVSPAPAPARPAAPHATPAHPASARPAAPHPHAEKQP